MSSLVLAEIGSTPYNVMLLLHLLLVVVGFAPAWLSPVLVRLTANGDRAAGEALEVSVLRYSLGGLAAAGILGFGLAGMSDKVFKMSQTWLSIAIVLWLAQLAMIFFFARPAIKDFTAGDVSARARISMATGITHLLLLAMLYLMIFKPGGPF
ncbi:MAG TPA: hypothetical protein VIY72_17820 [Acidimicrobiales bacterium]